MGRATSKEGKAASSSPERLRLYDYDIDGDQYKSLHRQELDRFAGKVAPPPGQWTIWIWGGADRLGDAEYNKDLSHRRIQKVMAYLRSKPGLGGVNFDNPLPAGESPAAAFGDRDETENEWFRCVEVVLTRKGAPPPRPEPPPHPPHPPKPPLVLPKPNNHFPRQVQPCVAASQAPIATAFEVQMLSGGSGGTLGPISGAKFNLMIRDPVNRLETEYLCVAAQLTLGASLPTILSPGSPSRFNTEKTRVTSFTEARFSRQSVSATQLTLGYRTEHNDPPMKWVTVPNFDVRVDKLLIFLMGDLSILSKCKESDGARRF